MAVHASSVISTTINSFDSVLYTAITDKEEYCFDSGTNGGVTEYQPLFQNLSDSIEAWMDTSRNVTMRDFIQILYGYKMMVDMFSIDNTYLALSDADDICSMNDYRSRIKTDALAYYDDYPNVTFASVGNTITRSAGSWITEGFTDTMSITVSGSTSNNGGLTVSGAPSATVLTVSEALTDEGPVGNVVITGTGSVRMGGANISSDISLIDAAWSGQEQPELQNLTTSMRNLVSNQSFNLMFTTPTPLTTPTRADLSTYIFTTLNFKTVFDNLNVGLSSPI